MPQDVSQIRPWRGLALGATLALALPANAGSAAQPSDSRRCDLAAARAAEETGVPIDILLAITRVETGRAGTGPDPDPWPWTINADGKGTWYPTREEAIAAAEAHLDDGTQSFDVGCFQLNIRWHGAGFETVDDMFDPLRNAEYAAGFLQQLHEESGDWRSAVSAYHSRTPELAERYLARVRAVLEGGSAPRPEGDAVPITQPRENRFPLLQAGSKGSAGSLVPLLPTSGPLIGGDS